MNIFILTSFFCFSSFSQPEIVDILDERYSSSNISFSRFNGRNFKHFDWCSLSCLSSSDPHIGCIHKGDCEAPNPPCKFVSFSKEKIVNIHNKLRQFFATGQEPKMKGILVADMMALNWNDQLAFLAGCNLKTCPEKITPDYCHITNKFKTAGQNIAWSRGVDDCAAQAYDFVQKWYGEVNDLTVEEIKTLQKQYILKPGTGHFTQVTWSRSTRVGCALTSKNTAEGIECMLTCNYAPAGNVLGDRMFKSGEPGSSCPEHIETDAVLTGLCGGNESEYSDYYVYYDSKQKVSNEFSLLFVLLLMALYVIH